MSYIVTTVNKGQRFFLRGTTWAFHVERANKFETEEKAKAAIEKARQFMHPSIYKEIAIESFE